MIDDIPEICPECGAPLNFEMNYFQKEECPRFVVHCTKCEYKKSFFEQNIIPKPKEVIFSDDNQTSKD